MAQSRKREEWAAYTLTLLLEGKFTLLVVVLILSSTSIFTTLENMSDCSLCRPQYISQHSSRAEEVGMSAHNAECCERYTHFSLILRHIGVCR